MECDPTELFEMRGIRVSRPSAPYLSIHLVLLGLVYIHPFSKPLAQASVDIETDQTYQSRRHQRHRSSIENSWMMRTVLGAECFGEVPRQRCTLISVTI